ncbi:MAG: GNAT family N-acetyltransferase [Bacteroidetes bacterium]|nr:GNAT family N-acetyltransferase [Bacteroidota bacterium]
MEYVFKQTQTDNDSLRKYSSLLSAVFTETKKYTFEFLQWQYLLNPNGTVIGFDAFYGEELAAHYVTIPVTYEYKGELIKGLLSLNTATHPNHQGKKLFTQLAEKTYELGKNQGYKFVIGVANQNSTHGFIKKLGFDLISTLDVKIYFGNIKQIGVTSEMFKSHWNKEALKWRTENPSASYFRTHQSLICDTHISMIKAVLSKRKECVVKENIHPKGSLLKMEIGLNNSPSNFVLGINLPQKLKPSPLNLIIKSLGEFNLPITKENIYFELIDFDAY